MSHGNVAYDVTMNCSVRFGMFCLLETIELTISVEFRILAGWGGLKIVVFFRFLTPSLMLPCTIF